MKIEFTSRYSLRGINCPQWYFGWSSLYIFIWEAGLKKARFFYT